MVNKLNIKTFLENQKEENGLIVDVRAPTEFWGGHIPGAKNIPIFEDEERKTVGILYKEKGKEAAVLKGLELVGPKMRSFVERLQGMCENKRVWVHCWRGGMRSESMAWLWDKAGFEVNVLVGGYKAYRNYVQTVLKEQWKLVILSGKTGSGKTPILHEFASRGEQVIDLEGLANHKGSVFGAIGQEEQPTSQQFENDLFEKIQQFDKSRRIWVEDESFSIGKVTIPEGIWAKMKEAPTLAVEIPHALRVERLVKEYGGHPTSDLSNALARIQKRLGGNNLKLAIKALDHQDYTTTAKIALNYYDKAYSTCLNRKSPQNLHLIDIQEDDPPKTAVQLINYAQQHIY